MTEFTPADIDRSWDQLTAELGKRLAARRIFGRMVVAASALVLVVGAVVFRPASSTLDVTGGGVVALRYPFDEVVVDDRISVEGLPSVIEGGDVVHLSVALDNSTDQPVQLADEGPQVLETLISTKDGDIIGGGVGLPRYPLGARYGAVPAGTSLDVSVSLAALMFSTDPMGLERDPIAPGEYRAWVRLPSDSSGSIVVAGGTTIRVT